MIQLKNSTQISAMIEAGRITGEALLVARENVREGISTFELDALIRAHIEKCGAKPSFLGYCGFPGGQFLDPPLSTMDYQYRSIGYRAVDRLLQIASMGYKKLPLGGVIDPIEYVPCIRKSTRKAGRQIKKVAI